MPKGYQFTELDKAISGHLALGPETDRELYRIFFLRDGPRVKTRVEARRRKLTAMKKRGLINYKYYNTHSDCIVTLTKLGAEKLAETVDFFDNEAAWTHSPREGRVGHDLLVGRAARKMKEDFGDVVIHFEPYLKREASLSGQKGGRKSYFPDYRLSLLDKSQSVTGKSYNVEIVSGSITRKALIGKIRCSSSHIFFLCRRAEMLVFLYNNHIMRFYRGNIFGHQKIWTIHFGYATKFFGQNAVDYLWLTPPEQKFFRMTHF
jgi:hypothetical protein